MRSEAYIYHRTGKAAKTHFGLRAEFARLAKAPNRERTRAGHVSRESLRVINLNPAVRREKALVHSGWKSRPGTGSFRPVTIEAVVEVTKPLKPSVQRVAKATR